MNNRLTHIDIAKGMGILLVVIGHNWIVLDDKGELFGLIYSFHMPLFFLLSGIFFNPNKSFLSTLVSRADTLLKPYFVTLIPVAIYIYIFVTREKPMQATLWSIATGAAIIPRWEPLWFLPNLFIVSILAWLATSRTRLDTMSNIVKAIILGTMLTVGYFTITSFRQIPLMWNGEEMKLHTVPFSADIALITAFYFILGYLLRERIKGTHLNYLWVTIATVIFIALQLLTDYRIDLNLRRYDNLFVSTVLALTGIYIVISVSRVIAMLPHLAAVFSYIGINSLTILIFHTAIQRGIFDLLGTFSGRKFYNGMVAFLGAVMICLLIAEIIKRIKVLSLLYLPAKSRNDKSSKLLDS